MKGGLVKEMRLNEKNLSLEISIATNTDGNLNINLPRDNIDSQTNRWTRYRLHNSNVPARRF